MFQKTTQGRDAIFIDKTIWENLSDHDRAGFFLVIALSRQKAKQFEGVKWGAGHNPNRVRFLNLLVASQL